MNNSDNKRPIIGITINRTQIDVGSFKGHHKLYVVEDYITAVVKAGGIPLLLPIVKDIKVLKAQLMNVDGVLLSGGSDIQPHLFGEEPHALLGERCPDRDDYELQVASYALEYQKPLLGICRGLQILNVAFGGTLHQDLSLCEGSSLQHNQKAPTTIGTHSVEIVEGTKLHGCIGESKFFSNSFHHQAINQVAEGFMINAKAPDNVIEGIEKIDGSLAIGVQWHPELMCHNNQAMMNLFKILVDQAKLV